MLLEDNSSLRTAVRFLETLHPEIHTNEGIDVRYRRTGDDAPMRRMFAPSAEQAAAQAVSLGGAYDVYTGVATRLLGDGTKAGVRRLQAVWADLDAKDGHTRESRLEQLSALPYHPSILVWTGGGWHAYYLLTSPVEGPEKMEQAEQVMRRLTAGLDSDPVHDRSRIMRVPGTCNHKYGEPRPVVLEHLDPGSRYELDRLHEMAEDFLGADADGPSRDGKTPHEVLAEPIGEGKRNVALTSVAGSLRDRGLDVETIGTVLLEVNRARCSPALGDDEVLGIARSMERYPAGSPRYLRSPVRRIHAKKER